MKVVFSLVLALLALTTVSAQLYQGHVVFHAFFNSSIANIADAPFEGTAILVQNATGNVNTTYVTLTVRGLQANKTYGVHVHTWGDLSGSFDRNVNPPQMFHNVGTVSTVLGHFDVQGRLAEAHNCAPHATRHTGDLGNITVASDTAPGTFVSYTLTSELLDLGLDATSKNSIIGRAIVIHESPDNCVQVNLGNWTAVGVIGIDNVLYNNASQDAIIERDPWNFSPKADAVIYNGADIVGNVWFWSGVSGEVHMSGIVGGFDPNTEHAVYIHQYGNIINEANIGGIFMGPTTTHAAPPAATRHWGILGNLKSDADGNIIFNDISSNLDLISLSDVSKHSIIGRTIAFHNAADTGVEGSAGATTRWGIVGLANPATVAPVFAPSPNSAPAHAHAVLRPYFNSSKANVADARVAGTVDFQQNPTGGDVTVTIRVSGLQANKSYGIHVHTWGDLSGAIDIDSLTFLTKNATVLTVGGHFDMQGRTGLADHNCAPLANRHTGDLGNITIGDVSATAVTTITLTSELLDLGIRNNHLNDSIIGRAVVIHENPDGCIVPPELGAWVAVGVIGLTNVSGNSARQDAFPQTIKANVLVLNATTKAPIGDIQLSTNANGAIRAYGILTGFAPNSVHGMHVHVWGNEDSGAALGPHYSQFLNDFGHSLPPSPTRHWGDLGNVTADADGFVILNNVDINANLVSIGNPAAHGIIGRALTFHAAHDDGGISTYGGRVAYGTIGLANPSTVLPPLPTPATNPPATTSPPTGTTTPPVTTSPPTNNPNATTTPPITTSPPTNNPNATTTAPPTTPTPTTTPPPNTATQNQANLGIMIIAAVMTAFNIVA